MSPAQRRLALVQIVELLDGLAAGPARATPPRGATGCAAHLCRPPSAPLCVAPAPSAWRHAGTQGAVLSGSGRGEPRGSRCGSRRAACREHLRRARRQPPRPISRQAARCSALGLHPPACLQILRPLRLCRHLRTENGPAAARSRDHRCGSLAAGQRQRATLPAALVCTRPLRGQSTAPGDRGPCLKQPQDSATVRTTLSRLPFCVWTPRAPSRRESGCQTEPE